jgi:hypothetical protein
MGSPRIIAIAENIQSQRTFMVELICQVDIRQGPDVAEPTQGQVEATPAQKRGSNLSVGFCEVVAGDISEACFAKFKDGDCLI